MAILFALQFFSVGLPLLVGVIWTVTNMLAAWNPNITRSNLNIWYNGAIGVGLLAVAVFLAALYGWIPAPA